MKQVSIKWVSHEPVENKNKTYIKIEARRKSEHVHLMTTMAKNKRRFKERRWSISSCLFVQIYVSLNWMKIFGLNVRCWQCNCKFNSCFELSSNSITIDGTFFINHKIEDEPVANKLILSRLLENHRESQNFLPHIIRG